MSAVEVRATRLADTQRLARDTAEAKFVVDDDSKKVTFIGGEGADPVTLALPGGAGRTLTRVVRGTYIAADRTGFNTTVWLSRLWLVDESGQVAARSSTYLQGQVEKIWPDSALASLVECGVTVEDKRFEHPRDVNAAYPGALPSWWLRSQRTVPVIVGAIVVIVLVLLLVVGTR